VFRLRAWMRNGPLLVALLVIVTLRSLAVHSDVTAALEAEAAGREVSELRGAAAQKDTLLAKKEALLVKRAQRIEQLEKALKAREKELKVSLKPHARGNAPILKSALAQPRVGGDATETAAADVGAADDTEETDVSTARVEGTRARDDANGGGGGGEEGKEDDPDESELEAREAASTANLAAAAAEEEEAAVWASLESDSGRNGGGGGSGGGGVVGKSATGSSEKERRRMDAYRRHRAEAEAAERQAEADRAVKAKLDAKIAKAQGPKHWKEFQEHLRLKAEQEKDLVGLGGVPQDPATEEEEAAAAALAATAEESTDVDEAVEEA